MLLTISTTYKPATDLGYLLAKNPARAQSFALSFGQAHVFYPQASEERCSAALLLDIDPVGLVRGRGPGGEGAQHAAPLYQYVNDRPYVASSFLSVAIAEVFSSAMAGRSRERPALAELAIPLEACVYALPVRGDPALPGRLFAPLGYAVAAEGAPLDPRFPEWGASPYVSLTLRATLRLSELLTHLYVLIPVLDADKHYYFGPDEIEKLLRRGEGWLAGHPERELIAARYLRRRRLVRAALEQLEAEDAPAEDAPAEDAPAEDAPAEDAPAPERRQSLHDLRLGAAVAALRQSGAARVLDLGCGEGRLVQLLLAEPQFSQILGVDVSYRSLERAAARLERLPERQRRRAQLIQGALTYRDERLAGYDAAAVVEVIEHLDPARLAAFRRVLFEQARPKTVVITTPNSEYNVRFPTLPAGAMRHADHRFEWTRAEFAAWCAGVAAGFGYQLRLLPVGPEDPEVGPPSQMAIFSLG